MPTSNLNIPKLGDNDLVDNGGINDALDAIDKNALNKKHADSNVHWASWKPKATFYKGDIIRLDTMPTWGVLKATTNGTTSETQPTCPINVNDTVVDGNVTWALLRIGVDGGGDWCTKKQALAYAIALG